MRIAGGTGLLTTLFLLGFRKDFDAIVDNNPLVIIISFTVIELLSGFEAFLLAGVTTGNIFGFCDVMVKNTSFLVVFVSSVLMVTDSVVTLFVIFLIAFVTDAVGAVVDFSLVEVMVDLVLETGLVDIG